ncbi:MAG: sulfatase-like hydrolase/transferase [Gemmatimonadetes bacterium]|nr:sulfatase-like hydrolase/transferase [Gemmatimonadota bacterium]
MSGDRPNVLLIMTDQQPVSTIGCYGNSVVKTPAQDRLAQEGMRFDNFYIAAFPCTPSRATYLTGCYTHNHEVVANNVELDDALPSIGNTFRDAGYQTAWIGKWHLGGNMYRGLSGRGPFDDCWVQKRVDSARDFEFVQVEGGTGEDEPRSGFDHWVGGWKHFKAYLQTTGLPDEVKNAPRVGNHQAAPSAPDREHSVSLLGEDHHMAHFFADEMVSFLNANRDNSFCAVLSFYGPHLPVCPPEPWDSMYDLDDVALPDNYDAPLEDKPRFQWDNARTYVRDVWSRDEVRDYVRRYWGYVSYIDAQIERVLNALDANGQAENTIVMFVSDHGDMVGQFGMVYKLTYCGYDTLMKVPCLVRWPGRIEAGSVNTSLNSSVDVMPTILDLAGVDIPEGVDGESIGGVLKGERDVAREEIFTDLMNRGVMIRQGSWKFVLNWKPLSGGVRDLDELYNLADDPLEEHNLAYRDRARAASMRDLILSWLEETGHPYVNTIREQALREPS